VPVLLGIHVSPAGGLVKALERGQERGCEAIQIFNQNPRAWKPREYPDEEIAAWHDALPDSGVRALLIHAVYLLNCASEDADIRQKSLTSLENSLRAGGALEAVAVVLHPGSALKGRDPAPAIPRAGETIREALANSPDGCPLHLENTAGSGGTLGRSFGELAALIEAAGGDERLGICLDSCHLYASGYDVSTPEGLAHVLDEFDKEVGLERLGSLHFNDSKVGLGSNVDRHAIIGQGELGETGAAAWMREPRFQDLPCVLETPGEKPREELDQLRELREP
jgi:deoxyribonuclease-4